MRVAAMAVLPVLALLAGCGSDSGTNPSASPTPGSSPNTGPVPIGASRNMTQLSHMSLADMSQGGASATSGAGNWGITVNGRRFALTGLSTGTSIVEVTNPAAPRRIAFIEGPASQWREIKTYRTFVYVTTEARNYGMDIIDMSDPDRPRKVQTYSRTFGNAHSLWIAEDKGLLFAHGTSFGMRVLDLEPNPGDPREVGSFTPFYIHDSYSRGNVLYAAAINNGFLALLDISDPANVREITRFTTGGQFTHNAWLSRDGRFVFTTDERLNRPVEFWDISDPLRPRKAAEYIGANNSIPHNVLVDGDRLLVAHYTEGVHLLDIRDPERPAVLGFLDTFTNAACGSFPFCGVWGAYIFPGSDLILASDMQSGLFVIRAGS
jgi:choice-of-anchor B domain-containing protein